MRSVYNMETSKSHILLPSSHLPTRAGRSIFASTCLDRFQKECLFKEASSRIITMYAITWTNVDNIVLESKAHTKGHVLYASIYTDWILASRSTPGHLQMIKLNSAFLHTVQSHAHPWAVSCFPLLWAQLCPTPSLTHTHIHRYVGIPNPNTPDCDCLEIEHLKRELRWGH